MATALEEPSTQPRQVRRLDSAPAWQSRWLLVTVIAGVALILIYSILNFAQPLNRDEGAFLVISEGVLRGQVPYRDLFDQKAPGIYYLLAPALWLMRSFSPYTQVIALRLCVFVVNLVTAAGIFEIGRRWWRAEIGAMAALLWLFVLPIYAGNLLLTEPFANVFAVWALVVAIRRPDMRGALISGLLVAAAILMKQTSVLMVPGVALVLARDRLAPLMAHAGQAGSKRAALVAIGVRLGTFGASLVAPWLVVVGLFALAGGLRPFIDQVVVANIHYPPDSSAEIWQSIQTEFWAMPLVWCAPLVGGVWAGWRLISDQRLPGVPGVALTLIGVLSLVPFKSHAYSHYCLQVLPWAALLTALIVCDALRAVLPVAARGAEGAPLWRASALGVLIVAVLAAGSGRPLVNVIDDTVLSMQAQDGQIIARMAPAGSAVLVGPAEPEYYFLAQHPPVTSDIYLLPVNLTPQLADTIAQQIDQRQFVLIVWATSSGVNWQPYLEPITAALARSYTPVAHGSPGDLVYYRPNTSP